MVFVLVLRFYDDDDDLILRCAVLAGPGLSLPSPSVCVFDTNDWRRITLGSIRSATLHVVRWLGFWLGFLWFYDDDDGVIWFYLW